MGLREFEHLLHTNPRFGELEADARANQGSPITVGTLGIVVMALSILILPVDINPIVRVSVSSFLILVRAPAYLISGRWLKGYRVDVIHIVFDAVLVAAASWLMPALWVPALVVAAALVVGAIPMHGRSMVVSLGSVTVLAFTGSGLFFDVDGWYLGIAALLAAVPGYDSYHRASQRRADETRKRYDALIEAAAVFFWEVDLVTGSFVSVAGNLRPMVGYSPAEFLKMRWQDIVPVDDQQRLLVLPELAEGAERTLDTKIQHRDGRDIVFRHNVRRTRGLLQGVSSNINDLAEATETIRFQAEHDALTGLYNRSVLADRLSEATKAMTADEPIAVLMLDLNRFKEVNDTLGHQVGDRLLRVLAERFRKALPEAQVVTRLGGDEFAVLLTDDVSRASALEAARKIATVAERKLEIDRLELSVSASIGVVLGPEHGTTADELLSHADIAMYAAKRKGEPVEVFKSMPKDLSLERLTLSAPVGSALGDGEFELWYQPKISLETEAVVGAEGLARWRHPDRGLLQPSEFLELIGLSGEYHRFTDQVLQDGVVTSARCRDRGHSIEMAVNLSLLSFFDQHLPDRLAEQLEAYGLSPSHFTLEVTESDMLDEAGAHSGAFSRLKELGVGISIDDFGTGHSSLVRLKELPVTELKLDRSFVTSLLVDPENMVIVRTIVNLAAALGLRTVAEGVESEATAEILRSIGCQAAQGFLYAPPMPADEFLAYLDAWVPGSHAWAASTPVAGWL